VLKSKKVIITNLETMKKSIASSIKEASDITGVSKPSICRVCNGTQIKVRKPYLFEYERVT